MFTQIPNLTTVICDWISTQNSAYEMTTYHSPLGQELGTVCSPIYSSLALFLQPSNKFELDFYASSVDRRRAYVRLNQDLTTPPHSLPDLSFHACGEAFYQSNTLVGLCTHQEFHQLLEVRIKQNIAYAISKTKQSCRTKV